MTTMKQLFSSSVVVVRGIAKIFKLYAKKLKSGPIKYGCLWYALWSYHMALYKIIIQYVFCYKWNIARIDE